MFYTYAYRVYDYFLTISIAGLPFAISMVVSRYQTLEDLHAVLLVRKVAQYLLLVTGIASFLALLALINPLASFMNVEGNLEYYQNVRNVLFIVSFALLIIPLLSCLRGFYQGIKEFTIPAFSMVLEQFARVTFLLTSAYICIMVLHTAPITAVYWTVGAATFAGVCSLAYILLMDISRYKTLKEQSQQQAETKVVPKTILKELVISSLPFVLSSLLVEANMLINLLFFNQAMYARGHQESYIKLVDSILHFSAVKINAIPQVLALGFGVAIIPIITSSLVRKDFDLMRKQANDVLNTSSYIALPIVFCVAYFSKAFYSILFGYEHYIIGAEVLVWASVMGITGSVFPLMSSVAMATRLRRKHLVVLVIGFIIKVTSVYPLIYLIGYPGAPLSTALSATFIFIMNMYLTKKTYRISYRNYYFNVLKMLLAVAVMFAVAELVKALGLSFNYQRQSHDFLILAIYGFCTCGAYLVVTYLLKLPQLIFDFNLTSLLKSLKKEATQKTEI